MPIIKLVNLSRPLPQYTLPDRIIACNAQNTNNGHNVHPLPRLQNNEPVVISSRYNNVFEKKDDPSDILDKINSLWLNEDLFLEINNPEAKFYRDYLNELVQLVTKNYSHFFELEKIVNKEGQTPFEEEFKKLINKKGLNSLQKAITLTQALELSFLSINVSKVLKNINNVNKRLEKNRNENCNVRKKTIEEESHGYRQELQAGWFLAKFIYGLSPSLSNANDFIHLKKISKIDRDRDPEFIKRHEKEADIFTEDALVSVKSYQNKYNEQIRDLFFMVIDDESLNLKEKIKKIVLIRCAENSNQYLPNYMDKREYKTDIKDKAIQEAKESILKYGSLTAENEKHFRRLVSPQGIDIYFIPSVNDIHGTRHWTKKRLEFLNNSSVEKIA